MIRLRAFGKWLSIVLAAMVIVLAVMVLGLHLWLQNSPEVGASVVARVARVTGIHFEFSSVDARLGVYGPEIVFRDARIVMPGQEQALVTARAGRVGFDLWRALRTGRLMSGRVVLDGARTDLYLTESGVELRGQGESIADDRMAHLAVQDLPVGHVRIENGTVNVQDLRAASSPWRLDVVALELERDPASLHLKGRVHLPDAAGADLSVDTVLEGDLGTPETLAWRGEVAMQQLRLERWRERFPEFDWWPRTGHGNTLIRGNGVGAVPSHLEVRLDLRDLTPVSGASIDTLTGQVVVTHEPGHWLAAVHGLTIGEGARVWRRGDVTLESRASGDLWQSGTLRAAEIDVDMLSRLIPFLPNGDLKSTLLDLHPGGQWSGVDLAVSRDLKDRRLRLKGRAHGHQVSFGAAGAVPGVAGLEVALTAEGDHGQVAVSAPQFTLDLRQYLRAPVFADHVTATIGYRMDPEGLRLSSTDATVHTSSGSAAGRAALWLPIESARSPELELDFRLRDIDATTATRYLPGRILPPAVMAWLDHAFIAGRLPEAHLELSGELRRFPFRDGGGLFRVQLKYQDLDLHYQDHFPDVSGARGEAEFKNVGFSAHAVAGRVGGLALRDATANLTDYKDAELRVSAHVAGDAADALSFLRQSPIGPKLGDYFMKIAAQGGLSAEVSLMLPFTRFAERTVAVDGRLTRVRATLPGVDDEFRDITGTFSLHDLELAVPDLSLTAFGGPARLHVSNVAGASKLAGDRAWLITGTGHASAAHLQPALGITRGQWLEGDTDWRLEARVPRLEWRPKPLPVPHDAPPNTRPAVRELETRYLPVAMHLESSLSGLALRFPAPLNKVAGETRPFHVDLTIDPGLAVDAPKAPSVFKRSDTPHPARLTAQAALGREAALLQWRMGEKTTLERGTVRFGGGTPEPRTAPGLWIEGHLPAYDLSAWLAVETSNTPGTSLSQVLKGGTVTVDHFGFLGFQFPSVALTLAARDSAWQASVDGPAAHGAIIVPWQWPDARPLTIDLERLALGERIVGTAGGSGEERTDPRRLPEIDIRVRNLEIQKHWFGGLGAHLKRIPDGLSLSEATLKGGSFEGTAHGTWSRSGEHETTRVFFGLQSSNLLDTLNAWGFEATVSAKSGKASGELVWDDGIDGNVLGRLTGNVKINVEQGQLTTVKPGAGRVLGLLSLAALPRRLTLDFSDVTDKGFAFDSIKGDFEFRDGSAYTSNLALKGPAAQIGIVGRTGLVARDYDQTAKVAGNFGTPLAAAGVFAAGPAVGAALYLFSSVFKESLTGIARGYYRITGSWDNPKIERIAAGQAHEAPDAPPESQH